MRPGIAFEPLTDCFGALGPHDKKNVPRAFQGAAENNEAFLRKPVHEIGMLSPVLLGF